MWPLSTCLHEPKFCSKKCDVKSVTLGLLWIEILLQKCDTNSVTLGFIWTEILLKKMRHGMCDPWFYMKILWGRCMVELTDLMMTIIYEYKFCSKKCDMKGVTLGFVWTKILLRKVWHEMCEPWFYMNRNFAQKSAPWKVCPLVLEKRKGSSKKYPIII